MKGLILITCTSDYLRVRLFQAVDDLVLLLLPQLSVPLHPFESLKQFRDAKLHQRIITAIRTYRGWPATGIRSVSFLQLKLATIQVTGGLFSLPRDSAFLPFYTTALSFIIKDVQRLNLRGIPDYRAPSACG